MAAYLLALDQGTSSSRSIVLSFADRGSDPSTRTALSWNGWSLVRAMRISVSSWATTDADVERSLEAILRVAAQAT